jgi:TRAP-type C4-dicarboxylate transport system substrate-binding protein
MVSMVEPEREDHMNRAIALAILSMLFALPSAVHAQDGKTYVMKLSTATINDIQHEWMKRFAVEVERDSAGRIKAELYPASQLGSIPRQIEGTQLGSIQGWIGPPEFLVGVDARYGALAAPGLFTTREQVVRVIRDPPVRDMLLGLGANKGLVGVGLFPAGPSSIIMRKPVHHLAEFKGTKIRVLASAFQWEAIKRMDATPVPMSLGDVLPALQQGTIDGALGTMAIYVTMHYQDASKYVVETGQPWVNEIVVISKKWLESLPVDLQNVVRDDAVTVSRDIVPFVNDFYGAQRKVWTATGGELIDLPAAELAALNAKLAGIGDELSRDNPELNMAVKLVSESTARNK